MRAITPASANALTDLRPAPLVGLVPEALDDPEALADAVPAPVPVALPDGAGVVEAPPALSVEPPALVEGAAPPMAIELETQPEGLFGFDCTVDSPLYWMVPVKSRICRLLHQS